MGLGSMGRRCGALWGGAELRARCRPFPQQRLCEAQCRRAELRGALQEMQRWLQRSERLLSDTAAPPHGVLRANTATLPLLQAAANHRQSHTGQLSAATTALLLAGSAARVFTAVHVRTPPHRGHTDTAPHSGHGGS